jgi:hypothetical protein
MAHGSSFGLNDLEALLAVAHEAKTWIAAYVLLTRINGKPSVVRRLPKAL